MSITEKIKRQGKFTPSNVLGQSAEISVENSQYQIVLHVPEKQLHCHTSLPLFLDENPGIMSESSHLFPLGKIGPLYHPYLLPVTLLLRVKILVHQQP